jgi:DHA1 family multidrug resistance protein-like MFS transporter
LFGKMVDKWGTKWFLNLGFGISSSVLLVFSFVQFIPLVYILVGILGIGYALIIPAWSALIAAAVPSEKRGAVWGFFLTIEGSGMVVGPIVSGNLWDIIGPSAPFIMSGSVLIILLVVHIFISAREKNIVQ